MSKQDEDPEARERRLWQQYLQSLRASSQRMAERRERSQRRHEWLWGHDPEYKAWSIRMARELFGKRKLPVKIDDSDE